jgi:hypothetical protein
VDELFALQISLTNGFITTATQSPAWALQTGSGRVGKWSCQVNLPPAVPQWEESIDNEEFNWKMFELLQSSDNEEMNTNNGGSSGDKDQDHFSEALQRHSNLKTTLHCQDLSVTNHCSRNHIQQQQHI